MSETINPLSVLLTGIFISIIGALIAFIGGTLVGKASDIWDILSAIAVCLIGGFLAGIGGFVTSIIKRK